MICAAVSGVIAISTRPDITRLSQASSGMRPSVMPGQRMHRIVAMMLIAVPMLPKPETSSGNGPVVGAVARRERLRGQRRVREPSDVGRVAGAVQAAAAEKAEVEQQPAERASARS